MELEDASAEEAAQILAGNQRVQLRIYRYCDGEEFFVEEVEGVNMKRWASAWWCRALCATLFWIFGEGFEMAATEKTPPRVVRGRRLTRSLRIMQKPLDQGRTIFVSAD